MSARFVTGVALLLLAALLVASMPLSFGLLDHDPRSRQEIDDYLAYIHANETQYGARMALLFLKDAVVSIVAGAGLYLSFAHVNRGLALVGAAGWLISTAGFLTIDGIEASMIALADDHALDATGEAATLQIARSLSIASLLIGQAAFSSFAVGIAAFGILFVRHRVADVPPVAFGWLGLLAATFWLLLWTSVLTAAGFAFIPLGGISVVIWMLGVGLYLARHAEVPGASTTGSPSALEHAVSGS